MENKDARLAVESAMNRAGITVKDVEELGVMCRKSFYTKKNNMGLMRLSELLMLDKVAPFSEHEILVLFGREKY